MTEPIEQNPYLGVGIYGIQEAARLTGIPAGRIRRWITGYRYARDGEERNLRPVWTGQLEPIDHSVALGFLDLMELRFVDGFLQHGVTLRTIRLAIKRASEQFGVDHPFCARRFSTDGRTIFMQVGKETAESDLIDLVKNQYAFDRVLRPYLTGLEYDQDVLVRWKPIGPRKKVVVDPNRSFGRPITLVSGVPTAIIAQAVKREGNHASVARWYQLVKREVNDAVEFEEKLAA